MVCQAMETKQLQRESQRRLDGFMDQLRSSTAVDLSAKNLGEEGTQYVAEALAFNDRRAATSHNEPMFWVADMHAHQTSPPAATGRLAVSCKGESACAR